MTSREIEELLARRIGLDPVSTGPHVILARGAAADGGAGRGRPGEYAARAAGSEAEQQALIEEVVVPESWFFRDERPFRRLADHARERLDRGPAAAAAPRPEPALRRRPGAVLDRHHAPGRRAPGRAVPHRRGRRQRPAARGRPPRPVLGQRLPQASTRPRADGRGTSAAHPTATRSTRRSARRSGSSRGTSWTRRCWPIRRLMTWCSAATS